MCTSNQQASAAHAATGKEVKRVTHTQGQPWCNTNLCGLPVDEECFLTQRLLVQEAQ